MPVRALTVALVVLVQLSSFVAARAPDSSSALRRELRSAAELAEPLVERAIAALDRGEPARAIVLMRGALELSGSGEHWALLGRARAVAGGFDEAKEAYERVLRLEPSASLAKEVQAELERLRAAPAPFADQLTRLPRLTTEAGVAFRLGLQRARRRKMQEALPLLRAALALDPELPGAYRVIGAVHGRLGDPAAEQQFLLDYLRLRPVGRIASAVRRRLGRARVLSRVALYASFPCEVWVNGYPLGRKTPIKELELPPGQHTISFINGALHIIRNVRLKLAGAEIQRIEFPFGILEVRLNPWARVRANGQDLGLWRHVGLPAGKYALSIVANDRSRSKQLNVRIEAGKTLAISSW